MAPSLANSISEKLSIAFAICCGIWVPLRVSLFTTYDSYDMFFDLLSIFVVGFVHFLEFKKNSKFVFLASTAVVGLPLYSLVSLTIPNISSEYLLLIRLLTMKDLVKIRQIFHKMDNIHPVVGRIVPLSIIVPLLIHILACGWIIIEQYPDAPNLLFLYGRSVYWTITTLCTVGYGDIAARTLPQMAYANIVMVIGVAFFGYVLSNVASLLARLDSARESYLSNLDRIEAYLRYNNISTELRLKVREYLRYVWESRKGFEDNDILNQLPAKLQSDIAMQINSPIIEKVPLLKCANDEIVRDIVMQLKALVKTPGEYFFKAGDEGDCMYFIQKGQVDIISDENKLLVTLSGGSFFGEMALLTSSPRNASVKAVEYCDVFSLSQNAFQDILNKYPIFKKQVETIASNRTGGKGKKSA